MSWTPMVPKSRAAPSKLSAVEITLSKAAGRFAQRITLFVRPELLDGGLAWWTHDARVNVLAGHGDHAGMLRITPGGIWRIARNTGRGTPPVVLRLPAPSGAPADGCRLLPLEYDHADDWLEVTLPGWGKPAAAPVKTPYVGISARVPDPAIAMQAKNGGRVR